MNQPSAAPTTKVAVGAISGAVSVVLVYLVGLAGINLPPEVASSVTVIVTFLCSYFVKEQS